MTDRDSNGGGGPTPYATSDVPQKVERVSRFVPAPPEAIFEMLADPASHALIDGSGSVRGSADITPERLTLGSRFGMQMRLGVPYRITNEVVEFDEPRLIAWRHLGGHIWRYVLEPTDGGSTVTEEFDWRPARSALALRAMRAPTRNRESIEATLDQTAAHFAASS
ncbi:SRPBCC family protein [soil metagenome]